jgi:glycosyltransferase involved in cell wall biosynthesis
MKILFVQKMNGISGSELYMLQLMPELKRRGYDVEMLVLFPVIGNNNKAYIEQLASHGIKTYEIYNHNAISFFLFYKIYTLLRKGNYDLVQTNLIHADFWLSVIKFFCLPNLKILSVKHGYYPSYQAKHGNNLKYLKWNSYYWIEKFVCRVVNFNVTVSKGIYDIFTKGKICHPSRIRNVYHGLNLENVLDSPGESFDIESPYALIIGRLVTFKGHKRLIKAWQRVHAICPDLHLYLAGNGNCRTELETQVKEANLTRTVHFLGHVTNPHPLIQNCLFTLVTSTWEGFGLILLESWQHKKPIIAFDAPAMNEVIDDQKNGLLAKAKNVDQLAEKIIYLFNNPEIAKSYGEAGYQKLTHYYTLNRMTEEMEEIYRALLNGQTVPLEV